LRPESGLDAAAHYSHLSENGFSGSLDDLYGANA
jgi:hypothetical protein